MRITLFSSLLVAMSALASSALAHHPGEALDEAMLSQEQFFQVVDQSAPGFDLVDGEGNPVSLSDFGDKIVVLDFVFASCTDVCPLQSEALAEVQEKINASQMRDMVEFVTVTTDPAADTPEVMEAYGEAHGLDPVNWTFLTARPDDPEDVTRALSEDYNNTFTPMQDGQQMHGVVFHVIDRGGRLAAKFHGLQFEPVNMVLYINGLTNAPDQGGATGFRMWDSISGLFN